MMDDIPLPRKPDPKLIGESHSQAVGRFKYLETSLAHFEEVNAVVEEYFEMGHAELIPTSDLKKSQDQTFYLPIHVVRKE